MINDLKGFWEELTNKVNARCASIEDFKEELGLFFWERGGKRFAKSYIKSDSRFTTKQILSDAEFFNDDYEEDTGNKLNCKTAWDSRDFLDCLACWGKEQLETKIKELEK